jgi:hypothetical protein
MKVFPWLLTLAFAAVCFACWAMSGLVLRSLEATHHEMLPAVTILVIHPNGWILACPLPWLIYSLVLTIRRETTPAAVFIFAGTLFLAAAVLLCAIVIACFVPLLTFKT